MLRVPKLRGVRSLKRPDAQIQLQIRKNRNTKSRNHSGDKVNETKVGVMETLLFEVENFSRAMRNVG